MIRVERSALLPKPAEFMFDLINDVGAYPDYMRGCHKVDIMEQDASRMVARMHLKKAGISHSFTTHNELYRPEKIVLNLVEGPFSQFAGVWTIDALNEQASKVMLQLEFTIRSRLAAKALERLFKATGDEMVDAVCRRAQMSSGFKS